MTNSRKPISWLLILICVGLGTVLPFLLAWSQTLARQEPPIRLPALAVGVNEVLGTIDLGFYWSVPIVRAKDGLIYEYDDYEEKYVLLDDLPEDLDVTECQPKYVSLLEKVAGSMTSCREVVPIGEYCPAPVTVFASTAQGELWRYEKQRPCMFVAAAQLFIFVPASLLLAIVIQLVRHTMFFRHN